jgi:formamidopyrimidine-DNA glycosylase
MPELPEVETTRRALEPYLLQRTIVAVHHSDPGKYRNTLDAIGRRVIALERRGKYLIFRLESGNRIGSRMRGWM